MSTETPEVVWQRITDLLTTGENDPQASRNPFKDSRLGQRDRAKWGNWFRVVDAIAVTVWAYVILKVGFDFDTALVNSFAPELRWIVDFRLVLAISMLALIVVIFRKKAPLWALPYIALFPLVLVLWKFPKTLWRLGNWNLVFGVVHFLTSAIGSMRSTVVVGAGFVVSTVVILADWNAPTTIVGMVVMALSYLATLVMMILRIFLPSKFIRAQRDTILKFSKPKLGEQRRGIKPAAQVVNTWTANDATQFVVNTGVSLIITQATYFWAYRLDQYRKSLASYVLNPLIVFALGVQTVVVVTLLTKGSFAVDSLQFSFVDRPSIFTFLHYSLNACFFGEVDALKPRGDWAFALHTMSSVLMSVVVLILFPMFFITWRNQRSDQESEAAISVLKGRATDMADAMRKDFGENVEEIARRLLTFNWVLHGVLAWLMAQVPSDWHKR